MQRDRNHDVGRTLFGMSKRKLEKALGKPTAERDQLFVFQQDDSACHRGRVERRTARKIKIVEAPPADAAKRLGHAFAHHH